MDYLFPWKFVTGYNTPFIGELAGHILAAIFNALNLAIYTLTVCMIVKWVF